jgi:lipopolysaccharide export system protein LptC
MIGRSSLWLPFTLLLLLAGLSFWLERTVQGPENGSVTNNTEPESIVENFEAVRTDKLGRLQYRLSARKLWHFSSDRPSELETPRFVQIVQESGDMIATSRRATVSNDGKEVTLLGRVNILRVATPGQPALSLDTERLLVFPERETLRAPGPVEIRGSGMNAWGSAMELDAKRRVIKLAGRVKAQYQNAKP